MIHQLIGGVHMRHVYLELESIVSSELLAMKEQVFLLICNQQLVGFKGCQ